MPEAIDEMYSLIRDLSIDGLVRKIMEQKQKIGDFSLDLYYNDRAKKGEEYVARFKNAIPSAPVIHFRKSSFREALAYAVTAIDYMGGDLTNQLKSYAQK